MTTDRDLRVDALAVHGDAVFVADTVLPIVAEVDRATGAVRRVFTWPVSAEHRRRTATRSMTGHRGALWVASPLAGGLVRVDLATGTVAVLPLDGGPVDLVAMGDDLLVVGRHWSDDDLFDHLEDIDDLDDLDEGDDLDDGDEDVDLDGWGGTPVMPTPLWRIRDGRAEALSAEVEVCSIAPRAGGGAVALVRRPGDPTVGTPAGGGGIVLHYPAHVALVGADGRFRDVCDVDDLDPVLVDGDDVWLVGSGAEPDPPVGEQALWAMTVVGEGGELVHDYARRDLGAPLRRIDVETGRAVPTPVPLAPVAIVGGVAVEVLPRPRWPTDGERRARARLGDARSGRTRATIDLPAEPDGLNAPVVEGPEVWFVAKRADAVVVVRLDGPRAELIPVAVPTAPHRPPATAPEGLDLAAFEAKALRAAEHAVAWCADEEVAWRRSARSALGPPSLVGAFPDTAVHIPLVRHDRPERRYVVAWRLYTELGDNVCLDIVTPLDELLDSAWGQRQLDRAQPGPGGIAVVDALGWP